MANIVLTTDCQRNCSYCFAKDGKQEPESFTWDNFKKVVDFIATGPKVVNLLGGEPTLHEKFIDFLEYLVDEDFRVQVFTNGIVSDDKIDKLKNLIDDKDLDENQLLFCVNAHKLDVKQNNFLKNFNTLSYISNTIFDKDTDLSFLPKIIEEFKLDPTIRLGLAMPSGYNNKFLSPEDYRAVAKNIVKLFKITTQKHIDIVFDCGFPLCMFRLGEVREYSSIKENDFMFSCGSPLDIYPDLKIANCFPLLLNSF